MRIRVYQQPEGDEWLYINSSLILHTDIADKHPASEAAIDIYRRLLDTGKCYPDYKEIPVDVSPLDMSTDEYDALTRI